MGANVLIDLFRMLFFFLDGIVYPLISTVYDLLIGIANTSIFTEEIIDLFASKVYALLGIFMLFKVSFSIMTYIVNPDDFADKSKGFSKLIKNIILTLFLLIFTPWIFTQAMDIQRIILKDNIIGKIFSTTPTSSFSSDTAGDTMSYETFRAFYYLDTEKYPDCKGIEEGNPHNQNGCQKILGGQKKYNKYKNILNLAYETKIIDMYMDYDLLNQEDGDDNYVMNYKPVISTICGGFICWILIVFCFDIAVRSIKLGFLRMIAPVPIISRIEPKGKGMFDKWFKQCISTYLDLFIRLLAIYFAVFVISQVINLRFVDQTTGLPASVNPFVKIFIILGALLFAKELPKLIQDITGAKLDGKFTMSPIKKLGEVPIVGGSMTAGATYAKGALLATGRGAANTVGGGIKLGAGNLAKKFTKGKYGGRLANSGHRTLDNRRDAMRTRMDYTNEEAHGRFSSSGLSGGEFKGDTAGKMIAKDKEKLRSNKREGHREFEKINRQWQQGEDTKKYAMAKLGLNPSNAIDVKTFYDQFDGDASHKNAYDMVYRNKEFVRSLMALDAQDTKVKDFEKAYEAYKLHRTVTVGGRTYQAGNATDAQDLYDNLVKAQKTYKGLDSVHETMRKTYSEDAQMQDSLKFNKYNPKNPTKP